MAIFYGLGMPDFQTLGLNPERLLPVEPFSFSIEGAAEKAESKKFKDGQVVTAGSAVKSKKYTAKVGIQAVNWLSLQFAYGELSGITPSIALPEVKYVTVPATSPYEVVDADITDTNVWATTMTAKGTSRAKPLTKQTGTVAAGEFKVDVANTKLIFHSSQAGQSVAYRLFKTYTNIESIGAEAVYTAFSSFSFSAIGYLDEELVKLVVPKMTSSNIPTLNISDSVSFELEYEIVVTGTFRTAFQMYNLSTVGAS